MKFSTKVEGSFWYGLFPFLLPTLGILLLIWVLSPEPLNIDEIQEIEAKCKSKGFGTVFYANSSGLTTYGVCRLPSGATVLPDDL